MTKAKAKPKAKPAAPRHAIGKAAQPKLKKVRELCLALPDVTEKPSHGAPTFFRKKRCFLYFLDNHHGDGRLAVWCSTPPGAQAMLVDSNADHYFVPPYVGPSGWTGVRLDRDAEWPQIASVIESAHEWAGRK